MTLEARNISFSYPCGRSLYRDWSLSVEPAERGVSIKIVDTGPGVKRKDREAIFQPFQRKGDTSTSDGVGLGLAVARGLAEAMNGIVVPAETPGGGLTMTVTVPREQGEKVAP